MVDPRRGNEGRHQLVEIAHVHPCGLRNELRAELFKDLVLGREREREPHSVRPPNNNEASCHVSLAGFDMHRRRRVVRLVAQRDVVACGAERLKERPMRLQLPGLVRANDTDSDLTCR